MADDKIFGNSRIKDSEKLTEDELDKVMGGVATLINGKPIIEDERRNEILEKYFNSTKI